MHVFVRGHGLADTMSRYLSRRIEENERIARHTTIEIVALDGDARLEWIRWHGPAGDVETREIHHVFMMTIAFVHQVLQTT